MTALSSLIIEPWLCEPVNTPGIDGPQEIFNTLDLSSIPEGTLTQSWEEDFKDY